MADHIVLQRTSSTRATTQVDEHDLSGSNRKISSPGAGGSLVNFNTILPSLDVLRVSTDRGNRSMIFERRKGTAVKMIEGDCSHEAKA